MASVCSKTGLMKYDTLFVVYIQELNIEKIGRMMGTDLEIFEKNAQKYGQNIVVFTYPFINADEAQRTLSVRFVNYMTDKNHPPPSSLEHPFYVHFLSETFNRPGFRMDENLYREKSNYFIQRRQALNCNMIVGSGNESVNVSVNEFDGPIVHSRDNKRKRRRIQ